MYICPTCNKEFSDEEIMVKHYLDCWKEQYPYYISNSAPHSEDIVYREDNENILNFFSSFQK